MIVVGIEFIKELYDSLKPEYLFKIYGESVEESMAKHEYSGFDYINLMHSSLPKNFVLTKLVISNGSGKEIMLIKNDFENEVPSLVKMINFALNSN
jgi:hypothetical protein